MVERQKKWGPGEEGALIWNSKFSPTTRMLSQRRTMLASCPPLSIQRYPAPQQKKFSRRILLR